MARRIARIQLWRHLISFASVLLEKYDFVFYSLVIPIKLVMLAFVSFTKKGSQNAIPCVYLLGKCLYLITSILLLVWPFCLMVT